MAPKTIKPKKETPRCHTTGTMDVIHMLIIHCDIESEIAKNQRNKTMSQRDRKMALHCRHYITSTYKTHNI
jgi:hypothetical protein